MIGHRTCQSNRADNNPGATAYVDGRLLPQERACVSALDRGFTLGDGVFETMRLFRGRVFRLDQHLARLRRSAASIHLPMPETDLEKALDDVIAANAVFEAVLRLAVSRGVPQARGLLPLGQPHSTVAVQVSPFAPPPAQKYEEGFTAVTASIRRNEFSPTAFAKTASYLDNVLARMEAAAAGADEAIMLNTGGKAACGSSSNVFLVKAGALLTPSIQTGVLAGITRAAVMALAADRGIPVSEQIILPPDLAAADECFVTNTVVGVMPLVRLDNQKIAVGKPGRLTMELREAYERLVEAECRD